MDGDMGGEVHGVGTMKGRQRDGSTCGWNMDDKIVGGRIGFSDSCWENCHIELWGWENILKRKVYEKHTQSRTFCSHKQIHKKLCLSLSHTHTH